MEAVTQLAPAVGVVAACDFLGVARASFYRQRPILGPSAVPPDEPTPPAERAESARSAGGAGRPYSRPQSGGTRQRAGRLT